MAVEEKKGKDGQTRKEEGLEGTPTRGKKALSQRNNRESAEDKRPPKL